MQHHSRNTHWFVLVSRGDVKYEKCYLSLEIFSTKLIIKAHVNNSNVDKKQYKEEIRKEILEKYNKSYSFKINKGTGKQMTLVTFNDFPKTIPNSGLLDFESSVAMLKNIIEIFESIK